MRQQKLWRLPLIAAALLLVGAGCGRAKVSQPGEPKETAVAKPATISVANQTVTDGQVNIPSVTMSEGGWVVIHADNGGVPGAILGQALVSAGTQTNVKVALDVAKVTPVLHGMLHVDAGVKGKFEFPGGPDEPASFNGTGVTGSFQATVASAPAVPAPQATAPEKPAVKAKKTEVKTEPAVAKPAVKTEVKTDTAAKVETKTEPAPAPAAPTVRSVSLSAKQWEFLPSTVTVKKGDKVKLTITSTDVDHGFSLPAFGVNVNLKPGQATAAEFTADKTGSFTFSCSVFCGSGHGGMKGTLVVE